VSEKDRVRLSYRYLEKLEDVVFNVYLGKAGIQGLPVNAVNVFHHQAVMLPRRIPDNLDIDMSTSCSDPPRKSMDMNVHQVKPLRSDPQPDFEESLSPA
jgi:hypothetical protein